MPLQVKQLTRQVVTSIVIESAILLYWLALYRVYARFPLYAAFYTIPMLNAVERPLSGLNLTAQAWALTHRISYFLLFVINAAKWFLVARLYAAGRLKAAGVITVVLGILVLASVSLRGSSIY